jgi:hypothetical protein
VTGFCSRCRKYDIPLVGNSHYCKPCHAEYVRDWYQKNKDSVRGTQFKRKYGISVSDYDRMFLQQSGLCAICSSQSNDGRRLHVDHCHDTGKVRGLLCNRCNKGLGLFRDDPDLLSIAAGYIVEHEDE